VSGQHIEARHDGATRRGRRLHLRRRHCHRRCRYYFLLRRRAVVGREGGEEAEGPANPPQGPPFGFSSQIIPTPVGYSARTKGYFRNDSMAERRLGDLERASTGDQHAAPPLARRQHSKSRRENRPSRRLQSTCGASRQGNREDVLFMKCSAAE